MGLLISVFLGGLWCWRQGPGVRPGGRPPFICLAQSKEAQPRRLCRVLCRGTRCALLALRSDSHGKSGGGWQSYLAALLRQACGKSQRCDEACKRKEAQRHPCARKRRAPQGCPSDFRRLSERSACGAQRVLPDSRRQTRFFGHFLVADKKVTRPPGRIPGFCHSTWHVLRK